jgi:hypothetical protein
MSVGRREPDSWAARTIGNTLRLAAWTAAWVASLALARFGPEILWEDQPSITLIAIVFSVLVGAGMLFANKRNLEGLDELQRMVQLQAMAWSLGIGLVGGLAWTLFARHGLIGFDAEIAQLVVLMSVVYLVGSIAGILRYR